MTLALVLFTDAAGADMGVLRKTEALPTRLLLVGLPLTILLGFGVAALLFNDLSLFEVALLATMLAPTDAALGKAVVTNERVPNPVRQGLNVETGLRVNTEGKLFIGWFAPRGLASIVFAVIVLNANLPNGGVLAMTVVCTVILSIILHGISAKPWAKGYGERSRRAQGEATQ